MAVEQGLFHRVTCRVNPYVLRTYLQDTLSNFLVVAWQLWQKPNESV